MYDNAWWVKTHFPQTRIVDSLHIVEYYFHGGFPKESVAHDEWIDLHHVISPQLEHWLINDHQIAPEKVVDAPLVGLTADAKTPSFKERDKTKPFTVAYIGRMVRQKRPEAFILAAKAVNAAYPGKFVSSCKEMEIWMLFRHDDQTIWVGRSHRAPSAGCSCRSDISGCGCVTHLVN